MNVGSENGPGWSQARKRTCRAEVLKEPRLENLVSVCATRLRLEQGARSIAR
jgi:hypothetical protein